MNWHVTCWTVVCKPGQEGVFFQTVFCASRSFVEAMDDNNQEKQIKDLMISLDAFEQIGPDAKVADGIKKLAGGNRAATAPLVLIVEARQDTEEIVGILSLDDVLGHMESSCEPKDELPIFWRGQFREECEAVLDAPAGGVMSPITHVIHQNGTLTEAVHLMNSKRVNWLPVVEGESVVGILAKQALLDEALAVALEHDEQQDA
ncbi:MAG: CBS domain-containing protein [Deltaproteobacteria bacterium]|nr:CBS domain-containing protein [Deltaproteobacteria bacterium]